MRVPIFPKLFSGSTPSAVPVKPTLPPVPEVRYTVNDPGRFKRVRHGARVQLEVRDGCVFVVSDQHYHKDLISTSHKFSLTLADELKPWAIINNGDSIDAASISRFQPSSFVDMNDRVMLKDEMDEAAFRLAEYAAIPQVAFRVWNMGNHDARFETWLATNAAQFEGVYGFCLKDHFPGWLPAWRTDFMGVDGTPEVIIKHRFKGGMHAGQNNALWTGTSVVTGHDHMLKAYPIENARRLVWGIHAGTMAPNDSPNFTHYTEDNPVNWHEGFAILHFQDGKFIGPELVYCNTKQNTVYFRGKIVHP